MLLLSLNLPALPLKYNPFPQVYKRTMPNFILNYRCLGLRRKENDGLTQLHYIQETGPERGLSS